MEGHVFAEPNSAGPDVSADGPRIAQEHAVDAVLMCPELVSAPDLLPVDCSAHVLNWSPRREFAIEDHVADALSVLDEAGLKECVVIAWSAGTAVALELARRHPDRIRGLLLLGAPPTSGAELVLETLGVPPGLRRLLAAGGTASLRWARDLLDALTAQVPVSDLPARWMHRAGLLHEGDQAEATAALRRLVQRDWLSHAELSLTWSATRRTVPTDLTCPVTLLTGRRDPLAEPHTTVKALASLPQARIRILNTTHLIPIEAPQEVRAELDLLLRRTQAVDCARLGIDPPPPSIPRIRLPLQPQNIRRQTQPLQ